MHRLFITIFIVASFAAAAPALAQAPVDDTYDGQGAVQGEQTTGGQLPDAGSGGVQGEQTSGGQLPDSGGAQAAAVSAPVKAGNAGKDLPFTGLDLTLLFGGGVVLLGLGMGIRRLSRPLA